MKSTNNYHWRLYILNVYLYYICSQINSPKVKFKNKKNFIKFVYPRKRYLCLFTFPKPSKPNQNIILHTIYAYKLQNSLLLFPSSSLFHHPRDAYTRKKKHTRQHHKSEAEEKQKALKKWNSRLLTKARSFGFFFLFLFFYTSSFSFSRFSSPLKTNLCGIHTLDGKISTSIGFFFYFFLSYKNFRKIHMALTL